MAMAGEAPLTVQAFNLRPSVGTWLQIRLRPEILKSVDVEAAVPDVGAACGAKWDSIEKGFAAPCPLVDRSKADALCNLELQFRDTFDIDLSLEFSECEPADQSERVFQLMPSVGTWLSHRRPAAQCLGQAEDDRESEQPGAQCQGAIEPPSEVSAADTVAPCAEAIALPADAQDKKPAPAEEAPETPAALPPAALPAEAAPAAAAADLPISAPSGAGAHKLQLPLPFDREGVAAAGTRGPSSGLTSVLAQPGDAEPGLTFTGGLKYKVCVPAPYPGVQFRKSKNFDDRWPRYAQNDSVVEGMVEEDGQWLRLGPNVFLPMSVGSITILKLLEEGGGRKRPRGAAPPPAAPWWRACCTACQPSTDNEITIPEAEQRRRPGYAHQ